MSQASSIQVIASASGIQSAAPWARCRSNCPRMGVESRLLSSQVHLNPCQKAPKAGKRQAIDLTRQIDQDSTMKRNIKLLPPLALVGALALVPVTASSFAAADTTNYQELEKFMSVYERVKANYVEPVDDKTLIKGAIDGMLAALDPHSAYSEGSDFDQLKATTDGNYGGLGLSVSVEDGAVKVIAPTEDTPAWRAGIKAGD